ncbi:uncharacterized protein EAE97_000680 [Botrytis byssoidea]|uniref:Uncharacterized protein n=1 Tax=Botrytis byssoidea TaxID=139641 RepID=A0A9P5LZP6_9HELO|nr:uncharacterized protein EAE97_000680 [Botrytis byssoidea]KAF7955421.1 hypothetical protein EAE97_000680 [Botrytis byssoidea]
MVKLELMEGSIEEKIVPEAGKSVNTTRASGYSAPYLSPPQNPNTPSRDPQNDSRRTYPSQPQKPIQRSYSPLPKPPIGSIPISRAPSTTPPRPPLRAQTHPSANLYARGNSTLRRSESRKSEGNSKQENRERSARKGVQYEELKRNKERNKKADKRWEEEDVKTQGIYNFEKEKLDYRRRVERDCNRPVDRPDVRSSGAVSRGFHRYAERGYLEKRVSWKGRAFREEQRG